MLSQHLLCLYRLLVPSSPLAKYRPADGLRNTVEAAQPAELDEVYEVLHRANKHGQTIWHMGKQLRRELSLSAKFRKPDMVCQQAPA